MKLTKLTAGLLALCLVGGAMPINNPLSLPATITASAADYIEGPYGDLTYKKYSDHIEISDCDTSVTEFEIPAEIDGLPVTSIGAYAFCWCTSLTLITIPYSVTSIGDYAFQNCTRLTSINIPPYNNVTSIGDGAFGYCENLTSITIPYGVTSIGDAPFQGCTGLTEIITSLQNENYTSHDGALFNKNKTEIIAYPAGRCYTSYAIPDGVTSIGDDAFSWCNRLTSIKIPDSVTSIGDYAFSWCNRLTSIKIPDSVTSIGDGAFYNCTSLTSITIPESVTSIGRSAFSYTPWLESMQELNRLVIVNNILIDGAICKGNVEIPDGVTSIGDKAFSECTYLTSITIPDSVTSIGGSAFYYCESLTSINIPDSVTSIEKWAFYNCTSLTSITILNPDCEIDDTTYTISNGCDENYDYYYNGTIYGYTDSTAQAYAEKYGYTFVSLGDAPVTPEASYGDADENGTIELADAVLVLCNIIDAKSYPMTEQGLLNADVYQSGDGLSNMDALAIQKYLAQLIPELPESYMS